MPFIHNIATFPSQVTGEDSGVQTMKATLLEAVTKRFALVEKEPLYAVATLLDARYKDRYVSIV